MYKLAGTIYFRTNCTYGNINRLAIITILYSGEKRNIQIYCEDWSMQLKLDQFLQLNEIKYNSSCSGEQVLKLHTSLKKLVFWCNGFEVFHQEFESNGTDSATKVLQSNSCWVTRQY